VAVFTGLLLVLPGYAFAQTGDEELLPQEQAFAFSASLLPDNRLETVWKIAPGYYMYRDKFSFSVEGDTDLASPATLPVGKQKYDELFGEMNSESRWNWVLKTPPAPFNSSQKVRDAMSQSASVIRQLNIISRLI